MCLPHFAPYFSVRNPHSLKQYVKMEYACGVAVDYIKVVSRMHISCLISLTVVELWISDAFRASSHRRKHQPWL